MKKMQTKRVLCTPGVNTAVLCFRVQELWVGGRDSHQNKSGQQQKGSQEQHPRLFLESTASFQTSLAIKLHNTYVRYFFI